MAKIKPRPSLKNRYFYAALLGLTGGPLSALLSPLALSALDKYFGRSRESVVFWAAIGTLALPLAWIPARLNGWNLNLITLIHSHGNFKTYEDWYQKEKDDKEASRQAKNLKKAELKRIKEEKAIKLNNDITGLAGYSDIYKLADEGVCLKIKYFGHLAADEIYHIYPHSHDFTELSSYKRKWGNNPKYIDHCFFLDGYNSWEGRDISSPVKLIEYVSSALSTRHPYIEIKDQTSKSALLDCKDLIFRDKSERNFPQTSDPWMLPNFDPHVLVGIEEAGKICSNPGIKVLTQGNFIQNAKSLIEKNNT